MAILEQLTTTWSGFQGSPGYTRIRIPEGAGNDSTIVTAMHDFWNTLAGIFPNEVQLQVSGTIDHLDDSNGQIVSTSQVTQPAVVAGSSIATWAGPLGALIWWPTGVRGPHREIKGRTFLVPIIGSSFDPVTGKLAGSTQTTIQNAVNTLVAALGGMIAVLGSPPTYGHQLASGGQVSPTAVVLRSRRD